MNVFDLVATLKLEADSFFSVLEDAAKAVWDFVADSVSIGEAFDASMSKVLAISGRVSDDAIGPLIEQAREMGLQFEMGTDAASTGFNILRALALETGKNTVFTAQESADALLYMGMAGWDASQMLSGLNGIVNLSAASGVELARVSDIVTDALTAFKMEAADATHFADLLAITSARANTNVDLMGETFKYVAPVAGALGVSAEDTALAIGIMANAGVKASMAGTTLRNILSRLSTNAGATTNKPGALDISKDKLGVDFYDEYDNVRDFSDYLEDLRAAWKGGKQVDVYEMLGISEDDISEAAGEVYETLTDYGKAYYAKEIAGLRGLSGFQALLEASDEDWNRLKESIDGCAGAAQNMADIMLDNLDGAMRIFHSNVEGLKIAISDSLTPIVRDFVDFGTKSISKITTAYKEEGLEGLPRILTKIIQEGTEKVESYLPEFEEKTTQILSLITGVAQDASPTITKVIGELGTLIGDFLRDNSGLIITTVAELTTAVIPGLVAAIQGIGQGIVEAWPQIEPAIIQLFSSIKELAAGLLGTILDGLRGDIAKWYNGSFIQDIILSIPVLGETINGKILEVLPPIQQTAETAVEETTGKISNSLLNFWLGTEKKILGTKQIVVESFEEARKRTTGFSNDLYTVKNAVDELTDAMTDVVTATDTSPESIAAMDEAIKVLYSSLSEISDQMVATYPEIKEVKDQLSALFEIGDDGQINLTVDADEAYSMLLDISDALWSLRDREITITTYEIVKPMQAETSTNASYSNSGADSGSIKLNKNISQKYASAMSGGKILHGATIFGRDESGLLMGGETGPEAVVGVNSLNQQIREAVRQGLSGVAGAIASAVSGASQPIYVVLDTGELVGAIGPKMDDQLARYGDWKGGGRA